jgi:exopolysaccharide production protein ExoF
MMTPDFRVVCRALALAAAATGAHAENAVVSADDSVTVRVLSWDQVEGEALDWTALSGQYRVRSDGRLDLPLIDPVQASGRTTAAIGAEIASALATELALSDPPDATVTLDGYRRIVVGGLVADPGEVDFTAGMTVRHAIALAGGPEETLRRGTGAFRQMIDAQGRLRLLFLEEGELLARLARLRAEREGAGEIVAPEGLTGPRARHLLSEQNEIMERRRDRIASERTALRDRITLLESEIEVLERRAAALDRQLALAQEAREGVAALADEGLAVNSRVLNSERTLALVQNQVLETSTAILRARLDLGSTERELADLRFRRSAELIEDMLSTEARLAEIAERIDTTSQLVDIDGMEVAARIGDGAAAGPLTTPEPAYVIFRSDGREIPAEPDTPLEPGDLVELVMPRPAATRASAD